MCGIAGIVDCSLRPVPDLKASVQRMTEALARRGPDDWGIVTPDAGGRVVLGHRRLAIIDLSPGGHQPMRTEDGRFWITYNGEIYNYQELRSWLESTGVAFRSRSDTEVLLALYAREGRHCLDRLRGMFAFAIWDEDKNELFLARDRFGIKPLYYAQASNGLFLFSSELKAILSSGFLSPDIDRDAELAYLRRGSIPAPVTFYRDIRALPPAHRARLNAGGELVVEPYWSLSKTLAGEYAGSTDIAEVAELTRRALVESVKAHMVSDVPVGVFLSGGLDSTAILAAVRQFYSGPLKTFTIIFPGTRLDEGSLARQAAAYYGTDHAEIEVTREDFYGGLDDLFLAMDQPTVDGVNTYFVAKFAERAGAKVALSGLGGDEVLGGYKSFVDVPRLQSYIRAIRRLPWSAVAASSLARHLPFGWAPKLAHLLESSLDSPEELWLGYRALFTDEQIRKELGLQLADYGKTQSPLPREPFEDTNPFRFISYMEMEQFMIPQLLRDSDVFTMCHGLELRTPFVDHIFLGAALEAGRWPRGAVSSYKIALFRQMGGFLPRGHLFQSKMAFTLPIGAWLKGLLSDSSNAGRDLRKALDRPQYRSFVKRFIRGKAHWSRVWSLYVLERFKARAGSGAP